MTFNSTTMGRPIFLSGEVGPDMLGKLDNALTELLDPKKLEEGPKKATIVLSSNGGLVNFGEAIIERIQLASKIIPIDIIGATFVGSMGTAIFLSVPPARRYVTSRCQILIHPYSRGMKEISSIALDALQRELEESLDALSVPKAAEERIIRQLIKETGLPSTTIRKMWRKSHRFTAKEAVELGLASSIIR